MRTLNSRLDYKTKIELPLHPLVPPMDRARLRGETSPKGGCRPGKGSPGTNKGVESKREPNDDVHWVGGSRAPGGTGGRTKRRAAEPARSNYSRSYCLSLR